MIYIIVIILLCTSCNTVVVDDEDNSKNEEVELKTTSGDELTSDVNKDDIVDSSIQESINELPIEHYNLDDGINHFDIEVVRSIPSGEVIYTQDFAMMIFNEEDSEVPFQIIGDMIWAEKDIFHVADVNFDGYMDIYYPSFLNGLHNIYNHYWVWEPSLGRFVEDLELIALPSLHFDEERELITAFYHNTAIAGESSCYKYIDGELVCIRIMERTYPESDDSGNKVQHLLVYDLRANGLEEVFHEIVIMDDNYLDSDEYIAYSLWQDLDYIGKE